MDKFVDTEIYFELYQQIVDEATLSYRKKVLPTRMLKFSFPDSHIIYRRIGQDLFDSGEFQKSIFPLRKATITGPQDSRAQLSLAKALFKLEKENEAYSVINKALSLNPESDTLHHLLITELEERNQLQNLQFFSEEIAKMIPDPKSVPIFYFAVAETLVRRHMFSEALTAYRKALETKPLMRYDHHYHYGLALYNEGLFEEAIVQFEHVKKLAPHVKYAWNSVAYMNYCLGRIQKAREQFEEILQNGLEKDLTYANFLLVLYHLDEDDEAINQYKDLLRANLTPYYSILPEFYDRELKITKAILDRDNVDEETKEFNTKKLKGINFVLSLINKNPFNEGSEI